MNNRIIHFYNLGHLVLKRVGLQITIPQIESGVKHYRNKPTKPYDVMQEINMQMTGPQLILR
jgi:hypothetical protein